MKCKGLNVFCYLFILIQYFCDNNMKLCPFQVDQFLNEEADPLIEKYSEKIKALGTSDLNL